MEEGLHHGDHPSGASQVRNYPIDYIHNMTKGCVTDLWHYPSTRSFLNPLRAPPSKEKHVIIQYMNGVL